MSEPATPFLRVSLTAGFTGNNIGVLSAWLQSDAVRGFRVRPTKLALGADVAALLGDPATLRVDADDADPELYPTGERQSPRDDLTFPVDRDYSPKPLADAVWLLQQTPPGLVPQEEAE